MKIISVIKGRECEATEVIPPSADEAPVVDTYQDILQMLVTGAQAAHNGEESLEEQGKDIGLDRWGNTMNGWGNQSMSTSSTEENHGEIQWLHGEKVQKYVHGEGSGHHCYVWRRQQSRDFGYSWYRDQGWDTFLSGREGGFNYIPKIPERD